MTNDHRRILILCKTYPSPSSKYVETSCVAGMDEFGKLVRLFPVPFRLVNDDQQFKKWQWICARVKKATDDHRAESFRISVDTITVQGKPLSTRNAWEERRLAVNSVDIFDDFNMLEVARKERGITLGLLRPSQLLDLEISNARSPQWTDKEIDTLMQAQKQLPLFDQENEKSSLRLLRKLPFDFYYKYACAVGGQTMSYKDLVRNNFPFWVGLADSLQGALSAVWLATSAKGNAAGCLLGQSKTGSYCSPDPKSLLAIFVSVRKRHVLA
jgi:hypothetical protein